MPAGRWRRRPPLPAPPGTVHVCPIGDATPAQVAAYRSARDAAHAAEKQETPHRR